MDQAKLTEDLKSKHAKVKVQNTNSLSYHVQGQGIWPDSLDKTSLEVQELKTSNKYQMTLAVKKSTLGELQKGDEDILAWAALLYPLPCQVVEPRGSTLTS